MTCQTIMFPSPLVIAASDTVTQAVQALVSHEMAAAPVVDAEGRLVGVLSEQKLIALLLPKAATFESFQDISFLGDNVADLASRFAEAAERPAGEIADREAAVAHPDTSLAEALLLIYRRNGVLPVVARESRTLLGVVTADRALARILEVR
ncbi:MAG: CBS domain-containing protein [Alphaproteobacteria bacterium]|nr:CBS domain-containing protein [Alphaproteobacteria bacterium]